MESSGIGEKGNSPTRCFLQILDLVILRATTGFCSSSDDYPVPLAPGILEMVEEEAERDKRGFLPFIPCHVAKAAILKEGKGEDTARPLLLKVCGSGMV